MIRGLLTGLSLAAVVALASGATNLPCRTLVVIEDETIFIVCLNQGCVIPCSEIQEQTPTGWGTTCSCYGGPPRCCHLVLVPQAGGGSEIYGRGECKGDNEESPCPSGDVCNVEGWMPEPDFYEFWEKCLPQSG